jgi:DNA-binding beta-propeller fold protein YncE
MQGGGAGAASAGKGYLSPLGVAALPGGDVVLVTLHTAKRVAALDVADGRVRWQAAVGDRPAEIAVTKDGRRAYVSCAGDGTVVELDTARGKVLRPLRVGAHPWGLALSPDESRLFVCNRFTDDISVVDLASGKERKRLEAVREPAYCAVGADGVLVVGNMLAKGSDYDTALAAEISFYDTRNLAALGSLKLSSGCNALMQVACSPDGEWAYVVHLLSRFLLPTTQIERGWINTNALSVIHVPDRKLLATVLLDDLYQGAANPHGAAVTADGSRLVVTHHGTHEVSVIDIAGLHRIINATPEEQRADLANDLTFLYRNGVKRRISVGGLGPGGVVASADGARAVTANYFTDDVSVVPLDGKTPPKAVAFGPRAEMDQVRRGELAFQDARHCFQQWQSCLSCHPDVRVDGLAWDLLNDGIGNPKNVRSLLLSAKTPPMMSLGVREDMPTAVQAGFRFIMFIEPSAEQIADVAAFLSSLQPERSPLLDGDAATRARIARGKALFESPKTDCKTCHPAPLYTDLKTYDVGTKGKYDANAEFDTPTLVELFRTSPYLHDGSAVTLREVIAGNTEDKHGRTSGLSPSQIDDLATFLGSL